MPRSEWRKYLSSPGFIRVVVFEAAEVVQEVVHLHSLTGPSAQALGEAAISALMVSSFTKSGERVNIQVQPRSDESLISQAFVDAYPDGKFRGYVIPREPKEDMSQRSLWGNVGFLSILRTHRESPGQPYMGTVSLESGRLSDDLERYWNQSEQVPSTVEIRVEIDRDQVLCAGGVLVQAVAGASAEEIRWVAECGKKLRETPFELLGSSEAAKTLGSVVGPLNFVELEKTPLRFECDCSIAKVERALVLAGKLEMKSLFENEQEARIRCDFCTKEYVVSSSRLHELINLGQV